MSHSHRVSAGAFHMFRVEEAARGPLLTWDEVHEARAATKRINILTACTECKRRKVRCDGQHPCGPCTTSSSSGRRRARRCYYVAPPPRLVPSKKALEAASTSLEQCRTVLQRLYPDHSVQDLLALSREDLIALLLLDGRCLASDSSGIGRATEAGTRAGKHNLSPSVSLNRSPPPAQSSMSHGALSPVCSISSQSGPLPPAASEASPSSPLGSDDGGLTTLEQVPTPDAEWDEERRERAQEHVPAEADDVNALSLTLDRQVSYLGVSSIRAALMVMLKLRPALREILTADSAPWACRPASTNVLSHNLAQPPRLSCSLPMLQQQQQHQQQQERQPTPSRVIWSRKGQAMVDAYFKTFHVYLPMLDEPTFRAEYAGARRDDEPWQALANMVLALGSVAAGRSHENVATHAVYYERAMALLPLTALGSSHIEIVQALALIGGEYLHYVNRPNLAYGVLGAAIRMAGAMGLHKESPLARASSSMSSALFVAIETRRRTWWSLFCLDTWATMLTGRPSFGRLTLAINIVIPDVQAAVHRRCSGNGGLGNDRGTDGGHEEERETDSGEMECSSDTQLVRPLVESVKFCKIATEIQDAFATSPVMTAEKRREIDSQLVAWYESQPWSAHDSGEVDMGATRDGEGATRALVGEEEPRHLAECLMKWRFQDLRMLLHRPALLLLANGNCRDWNDCSPGDLTSVETCLAIAFATVEDIEREWAPNQVSGWKAAWYLYQAAMVPLLVLLWKPWNVPNDVALDLQAECRRAIHTITHLLDAMRPWSLTASRSRVLIARIFEAASGDDDEADAVLAGNDATLTADADAEPGGDGSLATGSSDQGPKFGDGHMPRTTVIGLVPGVSVSGNFLAQQGLSYNLGLDFGVLSCEQDAAMAAAMHIDSYDLVDPCWKETMGMIW